MIDRLFPLGVNLGNLEVNAILERPLVAISEAVVSKRNVEHAEERRGITLLSAAL